jgi:hypothetical protein
MGIPTSEVGYTSATTGRVDYEVHKEHVVALEAKKTSVGIYCTDLCFCDCNVIRFVPNWTIVPAVIWLYVTIFHVKVDGKNQ